MGKFHEMRTRAKLAQEIILEDLRGITWRELNQAILDGLWPVGAWYMKARLEDEDARRHRCGR